MRNNYKVLEKVSISDIFGKGQKNRTPLLYYIMSEEHKMTKQDKLVLTITLAAIFFGVFGLGLIGLIFNLLN